MTDRKLFRVGAAGTVIAAVCCFTPALVVLLGAIGLAAWLAWLDYVLFPALFGFAGLTLFALARRARSPAVAADPAAGDPKKLGTRE